MKKRILEIFKLNGILNKFQNKKGNTKVLQNNISERLYTSITLRLIHIKINSKVLDINYLDTNVLLVPYDPLNNHGLLRCIIPDKIYIDNIGYKYNYLIGISNEEIKIDGIDCILHSKLLERGIE